MSRRSGVDVVIKKTVVFGLLALFITLVYALVVGGIGALVGANGSSSLSFVAAVVLAIGFQPARDRARQIADRVVYGKRATPYEVLATFSDTVGEALSSEDVLPRMAEVLAAGTGASDATVWLRVGGTMRPEASWPSDARMALATLPDDAVEVVHQGELLGALSVQMPANDPSNPAKVRLVQDLAAQGGLVLRNVRLIEELRASRHRLVAAQDHERRKIERNLHDGAQQELVALSVKLRLAQGLATKEPAKSEELLDQIEHDAQGALGTLRDLARGIFPPLLVDQGLVAALDAQGRKALVPVRVVGEDVGRYPQEIEAAVYFCCLEALQNVAKYAEASSVTITLHASGEGLRFEVKDDGRGFDTELQAHGTGLQGMADRLDAIGGALQVESTVGVGTTVTGSIPGEPIAG